MKDSFAVAILAAGLGTRFRSKRVKVLHSAGGRTLVEHVVRAASELSPDAIFVIVGHQADDVIATLQQGGYKNLKFIRQQQQLGTGHALMSGREEIEAAANSLMVVCGDTPLLEASTLAKFRERHAKSGAVTSVLTAEMDDPTGYGRIVRESPKRGSKERESAEAAAPFVAIVEQKSATPAQLKVREINTGIYCFDTREVFSALSSISPDPITKEYYLTDVVGLLVKDGKKVEAQPGAEPTEVIGINNRVELARVDAMLRLRKARELMLSGVTIHRPGSVRIDPDVEVGMDSVIEPGVTLLGRTRTGSNCTIGAHSVIRNSQLSDAVSILPFCVITDSTIADSATIGPFAHLRPGSDIGPESEIGAFVEVKKSKIGRHVRAHHLAYLGDAVIGKDANIGAGTITCNYDGTKKSQTVIEEGAFIGSGTELVAPVTIGRNAYIAAGSVITDEVPPEALAIARERQTTKPGWVSERKKRAASKALV